MKPLLLHQDPARQKRVRLHSLSDGDQFVVETQTDVTRILEENTALRNAQPAGWRGREHLVASLPMPVWTALRMIWRELGLGPEERQAALHRFLNDPDNAKYRTKSGRL